MRFWDTSAIMPLIGRESFSERIESVLVEDEGVVVWWATRVECVSAIRRRAREGSFSREEEEAALDRLVDLSSAWSEVRPSAGYAGSPSATWHSIPCGRPTPCSSLRPSSGVRTSQKDESS